MSGCGTFWRRRFLGSIAYSLYDVLPVAGEVDRLLCGRAGLAELPGRFLFALDDGRGDLASAQADVGLRMVDGERGELVLAGVGTGVLVGVERAAEVMVAAAEAFLVERAEQESQAWRLKELADGPLRILARLELGEQPTAQPDRAVECGPTVAGRFEGLGGAEVLVVAVPLGVLDAEQAAALAEYAEQADARPGQRPVLRVTPSRSVVVAGVVGAEGAVRRLKAVGLVLEASSPWNGVTGCAGRPGCAKALADVRADARRVVPGWSARSAGRVVHWSGCERRCGRPGGEFVDVVALAGGGYSVDGTAMTVNEVGNEVRAQ